MPDWRANLPGAEEFRDRLARCRTDHVMLVRLEQAEHFARKRVSFPDWVTRPDEDCAKNGHRPLLKVARIAKYCSVGTVSPTLAKDRV